MRAGESFFAGAGVDVAVAGEDVEELRGGGRGRRRRDAGGVENGFELAGADDGVDLRNVFADLVAIALDEAAGDDELARGAGGFVARHLEDGVDRLLPGRVDEAAGVDDEDFGVLGARGKARAGAVEQAHHDLAVDEVLGAAQRNKAHGGSRGTGSIAHDPILPECRIWRADARAGYPTHRAQNARWMGHSTEV